MVDDQCSHFTSIELVKCRPAHLLVFLQHVMLQFDCTRVLCYLHADLFKQFSAKETKKQFVDFYNTFLDKGAVLRVPVPPHVAYELDRTRPDLLSDDVQKRYAQEIQALLAQDVIRQLEDFRQKRMMGMTPSEAGLLEVESYQPTDKVTQEMKERAVAEALLDKMSEMQSRETQSFQIPPSENRVKNRSKERREKCHVKDPWHEEKRRFHQVQAERGISPHSVRDGTLDRGRQKSVPNMVSGSVQGSEGSEGSGVSISVTSSPDSSHSEMGLPSSRSDPQSISEGGDVSPAGLPGNLSVWEAGLTSDTPLEDSQDKDRPLRLGRSESLCVVDRRRSLRGSGARGKQSRSRSDVDLQAASASSHPPSPSPSHCPLEQKSVDADVNIIHHFVVTIFFPFRPLCVTPPLFSLSLLFPSYSLSLLLSLSPCSLSSADSGATPTESSAPGPSPTGPTPPQEELEPRLQELEQDPPNWREQALSHTLSKLSKKETKRQEVINELFITEHAHVRMLSVLQTVFFRPLEREAIMTLPELSAIFPSLDEIIDMHYAFYESMKKLRQENNFVVKSIGSTLLHMFNGAEGEWFQKLTSRFCSHQSYALEQIKTRQKKDPRFNTFIQDAESKPQCRRLQLKDIIPIEMQRLTKYPLLLENIAKSTEDSSERECIQQAADCCRKILNHVNEEVKEMENLLTLRDYQRRLDTSGLKPSNDLYVEYKVGEGNRPMLRKTGTKAAFMGGAVPVKHCFIGGCNSL
ncbi:hypothetical protein JZ751_028211 [Albula glossodonta]|uniref:DH domain-containing protein n=1 Tax=Albula glossodonta TaxID=121402 RepID=A0A8T2NCJ2_9TELE|nr:hypothetical protein JZ751_028211 [Albula glossodonta]